MLIRTTREAMLQAIKQVGRAVSAHPVIPLLTGIHMSAQQEELRLTASNMAMTIEVCIQNGQESELVVERAGAVVVPAKYMHDIIQRLDPGRLMLEQTNNDEIVITSGLSRFRLNGLDPHSFPLISAVRNSDRTSLYTVNEHLKSAIREVVIATSASETRPVLTGVSATFRSDSLELMATNGVQLAHRIIPLTGQAPHETIVVIPGKTLSELSKLIGDDTEGLMHIEADAQSIIFTTGRLQVQSALLEGSMPSMTKLMPASLQSEIRLSSKALLRSAERVSVLAGGNLIRLTAGDGRLKLLAKTSEIGDVEDEVELASVHGEAFSVALNGSFLTEIMRCIHSEQVSLQLTGSRSPVMIVPIREQRDALYLLTPVLTSTGS
ncbi:DNA polymerase III subunit beta [Paenibacillus sp. NPDC057967]|uniref:DNA polymerase III subunit beta n=1 Tax=Paenibacillus sp. NPDC057967 TaxID=3346293 RepID=UPI0036DBEA31